VGDVVLEKKQLQQLAHPDAGALRDEIRVTRQTLLPCRTDYVLLRLKQRRLSKMWRKPTKIKRVT
jgi:hypothetical protein